MLWAGTCDRYRRVRQKYGFIFNLQKAGPACWGGAVFMSTFRSLSAAFGAMPGAGGLGINIL